ncbi:MAG: O-antigen ligase family protein, partial [Candidatus Paceibacteria bacterium]
VLLIVGMSLIVGISGVLRTALIPTVIQTTIFITMGVVFIIIAYAMKTPGMMRTIFKALIVGTILNILFALYQAVAFKFGLLDFMVFEGRVNGFLPEPNWFAIWHSLIVAIWMPLTFFSPHWFSKRWNWMWWVFLYFNLVVILLSLTRASWLALCIMGILFYISLIWPARYSLRKVGSHIGKMTLIFVLAVVSIESIALSPFSLYERAESIITQTTTHYTSKDGKSLDKKEAKEKQKKEGEDAVQKKVVRDVNVVSRLQDYQRSLEISAQYPIGGVGIAGYKERVGETRNTSNIFLGALVAGGILGFSLYISMYCILIREVIRLIRQ